MYAVRQPPRRVRDIRGRIDHPIIDADAHVIEGPFALHDFVKQVAGPEVANKLEAKQKNRGKGHRSGFWASPTGEMTIDRATAMLLNDSSKKWLCSPMRPMTKSNSSSASPYAMKNSAQPSSP